MMHLGSLEGALEITKFIDSARLFFVFLVWNRISFVISLYVEIFVCITGNGHLIILMLSKRYIKLKRKIIKG